MPIPMLPLHSAAIITFLTACFAVGAAAQTPAPAAPPRPPEVVSPEVLPDRQITFRILAPQATAVMLGGPDLPAVGQGMAMTKGDIGVWEITIGPVSPGAYRYVFQVDGVPVVDPRSPSVSVSNGNVFSLVDVPGSDFMDTTDIPHGAVISVTYYSTSLSKFRRMHIYTPPGYTEGKDKYPVFYLLHGSGDSDDSWSSVGRAGFILDNLIAAHKAKPMIVVMPAGHARSAGPPPAPPSPGSPRPPDEFIADFLTDIMPYVEHHFRTRNDRQDRAIAGLSMGGGQSLNIALPHLDKFAYVGVFSAGLFGIVPRDGFPAPAVGTPFAWEEQHRAELDNAELKHGLRLLWFATGSDDFLLTTTQATVAMLKKHGFAVVFKESSGGHSWVNWRDYLNEFAPQLFQD